MLRIAIVAWASAGLLAPLAAQVTPPSTVEDYIRIYGGPAAARSFEGARLLAPFEGNVTLAEGCGEHCTVRALVVDARPRTDTTSRQLCFASPLPLAARIGEDAAYGFVTHAEATITTDEGATVLPYRLFARMETRAAQRAKPTLSGDWCATLPVPIREAAAEGGWSIALRALPPRDARFAYSDITAARLPSRAAAGGVMPVRFDPASMDFVEVLIRSAKPGARIVISGDRTRMRTPATLSLTEAASERVEIQQGDRKARLDKCDSQWAEDRNQLVFDCPI